MITGRVRVCLCPLVDRSRPRSSPPSPSPDRCRVEVRALRRRVCCAGPAVGLTKLRAARPRPGCRYSREASVAVPRAACWCGGDDWPRAAPLALRGSARRSCPGSPRGRRCASGTRCREGGSPALGPAGWPPYDSIDWQRRARPRSHRTVWRSCPGSVRVGRCVLAALRPPARPGKTPEQQRDRQRTEPHGPQR